MNTKKVLEDLEKKFNEHLQVKTNWKKTEVISLYKFCLSSVLLEHIEKEENESKKVI